MKLESGDRVKFEKYQLLWIVRCANERFAVLTKKKWYTIIDFERGIRGPHNLVFNLYNFSDQSECERCLVDLMSDHISVSRRHVELDIVEVVKTKHRAERRDYRRDSVADQAIEGLRDFSEWLESGSPPGVFRITEVRRAETPDGPMHLRTIVDKGSVKDGNNA